MPIERVALGIVFFDPDLMDGLMSRMVRMLVCVAAVVVCCEVQAGGRGFTRHSSRVQANSGSTGHYTGLPGNSFEGVGMGMTRQEAIRNACQPGGGSRRAASKSVTRGANGQFYSSVLYNN